MLIQWKDSKVLFHLLVLLYIWTSVNSSPVNPTSDDYQSIKYLECVHRLGHEDLIDCFFSCTVAGEFMQWKYNDEHLSILGSNTGSSRAVPRPNYNYTMTLLYSKPLQQHRNLLVSLLMVSFDNGHLDPFNITCISNNYNASTEVKEGSVLNEAVNSDGDNKIRLDYILSDDTVPNKTTSIFMCGTKNSQMYVQIGKTNIFFAESDNIGYAQTNLSMDSVTVKEQSILIAQQPHDLVSIIIVSGTTDVNVTCYFGSHKAIVSSSNDFMTLTSMTSSLKPTLPSSLSLDKDLTPTRMDATFSGTNHLEYSSAILLVIIPFVLLQFCYSNKKQKDSQSFNPVVVMDAVQEEAIPKSGMSELVNSKSTPQGKPKWPAFRKTASSKANDFRIRKTVVSNFNEPALLDHFGLV